MTDHTRRWNRALLSLGANVEPERNLPLAVRALAAHGRVVRVSTVWETPPVGPPGQPTFLNAAVWLETELGAEELKDPAIARIEERLGRVRSADRYAARPIDIDVVLFNDEVFELGRRRIPDAEMLASPFVAIPLAEIAPSLRHPETGEPLASIARRFDPASSGMHRRDDVRLAVPGSTDPPEDERA